MMPSLPLALLVLIGVGAPAALFLLLGSTSLLNRPLPERWIGRLASASMLLASVAFGAALVVHGVTRIGTSLLSYGEWSASREGGIAIEFLVDRLSLGFALLSATIAGIVSAFSNRYLHRERGYNRYFVLFALFVTGMLLIALAGNIEVLFIGWECVGLSSTLLVAFFQDRPAAVTNALRVFTVYRISDASMLAAAVLLSHQAGTDSLALLFGGTSAASAAGLTGTTATMIATLLIVAVAGKSALLPFSGWLPRAMEGPTPSSAVYYGSLSIHAGCFLLLRAGPVLEHAPIARGLAGVLGATTAVFGGLTTRVQSDVKSGLAYASLTQVGLIIVEIALGWYAIAFVHLAGHASFRLLQFLSASNVLHDLHSIEDALGNRPTPSPGVAPVRWTRIRREVFLFALERGFLDSTLDRMVVAPFVGLAHRLTRFDGWLCGLATRARPIAMSTGGDDHDE